MESVETVRLRPSLRRRLPEALVFTAAWVCVVVLAVAGADEPWWIRVLMSLVLLPSVALRWVAVAGIMRQPWAVEIGAEGVRFPSGRLVPWSDLDHVLVVSARGWRRLAPHLPNRLVLVTPVQADFARRSATRPNGDWIRFDEVAASVERLVSLVQRFSNVPVVGRLPASEPGASAVSRFGSTKA